jgi:hypothetical protein
MHQIILESTSVSYGYEVEDSEFGFEEALGHVVKGIKKQISGIEEFELPLCIFRHELSGLQAIVKYLKENKNLQYFEIAKVLGRDQRTIWCVYNSVKSKKSFSIKEIYSENKFVDASVFRNRRLSVLEVLASELRARGMSNSEISSAISKSQKTVWTVLDRMKKKIEIDGLEQREVKMSRGQK